MKTQQIKSLQEFKNELKNFFVKVPFGRYFLDKQFSFDQSFEIEYSNLQSFLENGVLHIVLNAESQVIGLIGFKLSPWDSDIFRFNVSTLNYFFVDEEAGDRENELSVNLLQIYHRWVEQNKIRLVIAKLESQYFRPVQILQENGYIFYECITQKSNKINRANFIQQKKLNYRFATDSDRPRLIELANKNTFHRSHFYLDSRLETVQVDALYSKWIEQALSRKNRVIVIEEQNYIVGVFIYSFAKSNHGIPSHAIWEFAALDSDFRGRNLGNRLFQSAFAACIEDGADFIDTTLVEKNLKSQILHDKLGFQLVNCYYRFHRWF